MRVKKFTGRTVNEAVGKMKAEFGRDAVILHTKRVRSGGVLGLFGRVDYEVIAAMDRSADQEVINEQAAVPYPRADVRSPAVSHPPSDSDQSTVVKVDTKETKDWPNTVQNIYQRLIACDIPKDVSKDLLKSILKELPQHEWKDLASIWNHVNTLVAQRIATVEPWNLDSGQKVVVLVGPTGVGKTTTIAKLAANFALIAGKKVGLVTVDTYRIAAVEQLRTYADIIGVPIAVAYNDRELEEAVQQLADRDLILIDTAGRSHRNHMHMAELKKFLDGLSVEVHLVVSATTKGKDLEDIVRMFREFSIDRVIVTKLDETTGYGVLLHAAVAAQAPIAFVTTGQSVPDDIEVAEPSKIANLILGDK